jgi:xanthine dehydrogenase YagS FAD-binding subunit
MMPFRFSRATSDASAIEAAANGAVFLAGGTTLVDLMRDHVEQPAALIDINRLPHRQIELTAGRLKIGALARMSDVAADPKVKTAYPVIAESLLAGASAQLRNMASIGGNLMQRTRCTYFRDPGSACNKREPGSGCPARIGEHCSHAIFGGSDNCIATHASDLTVALVALDAVVNVRGRSGERSFPLHELYRLPGATPHQEHTLSADELIVSLEIPAGAYTSRSHYLKIRDRESYEFALVSAAVAIHVEGGVIVSARLAAGGVGTVPWRLHGSEHALVGQHAGERAWRIAADLSVDGALPLPKNAYKVELLRRTVFRALEQVGGSA